MSAVTGTVLLYQTVCGDDRPFCYSGKIAGLSRLEFYLFVMKLAGDRDCAEIKVCGDFRWMDGARIKQKSVLVGC